MLGLYEWSKEKTSAIRRKAEDLESGRRDRSPSMSPDPYGSDSDGAGGEDRGSSRSREAADVGRKGSRHQEPSPPPQKKKKRYRYLYLLMHLLLKAIPSVMQKLE